METDNYKMKEKVIEFEESIQVVCENYLNQDDARKNADLFDGMDELLVIPKAVNGHNTGYGKDSLGISSH